MEGEVGNFFSLSNHLDNHQTPPVFRQHKIKHGFNIDKRADK